MRGRRSFATYGCNIARRVATRFNRTYPAERVVVLVRMKSCTSARLISAIRLRPKCGSRCKRIACSRTRYVPKVPSSINRKWAAADCAKVSVAQSPPYSLRHHSRCLLAPRLPERTVSTWAEKQLLCPSIEDATGRGSMRIWSENDLRQGELLVRLMPILRPELIREIAKQFKN